MLVAHDPVPQRDRDERLSLTVQPARRGVLDAQFRRVVDVMIDGGAGQPEAAAQALDDLAGRRKRHRRAVAQPRLAQRDQGQGVLRGSRRAENGATVRSPPNAAPGSE